MRRLRWIILSAPAFLSIVLAAAFVTAKPGNRALFPPTPDQHAVEIFAADHGIHVALIIPRDAMMRVASERGLPALIAVGTRFAAYENLEIGWGDESFYRLQPALDRVTITTSIRALLGLNDRTVVYIAGSNGDPAIVYRLSNPAALRLSDDGFARLISKLEEGFALTAGQPDVIGGGAVGTSLFYRGSGHYSLFNVCNHWTARFLAEAGVPTTPVLDTVSRFFILDLRLRAGAAPAP